MNKNPDSQRNISIKIILMLDNLHYFLLINDNYFHLYLVFYQTHD